MKCLRLMFVVVAVALAVAHSPAQAQDAYRITQLEDQVRQLLGQIETLNFQIQKLERAQQDAETRLMQLQAGVAPQPQAGSGVIAEVAPAPVPAPVPQVGEVPPELPAAVTPAPGPKPLGTLSTPGVASAGDGGGLLPEAVQAQGLDAPVAQTPDGLYQQAYEALLRSQFGPAQQGFQDFLKLYPQHELAGNATYWLGESLYAQANYKQAAQTFLDGYKSYPDGPKAPDTMLKLGLSLKQLGQKPQACSVLQSVGVKYPKAADAKKRALAEAKRAGCSA